MTDDPRIFVGTLHSGEGDFAKCCAAINTQTNVIVTHHIVSGLNEKDAHNTLWAKWREEQSSHDLFVKIDADTVLSQPWILSEIFQTIRAKDATGLQAPLHDYMTDKLIIGLNAFTPRVVFLGTTDKLYCDRNVELGNTNVIRGADLPPTLKFVGFHCHHASNLQGFRYGVHRAMKTQDAEIQHLIWAWRKHGDRVRGLGVIGSLLAPRLSRLGHVDYTDQGLISAYEDAEKRYDEYVSAINSKRFNVFD
jgi:hypothetical protein